MTSVSENLPTNDICILIPTLNEAPTIGGIIDEFQQQGFTNILVSDGESADNTREIAKDRGARVVTGPGIGKGAAVTQAIDQHITASYVVMIDGDGTYHPSEVPRLLTPLVDDKYEHVIGNRFANMEDGAMTRLNWVGNRLFNILFTLCYQTNYTDILSGYRAFERVAIEQLSLTEDGFGIETELAAESAKAEIPTTSVPITYSPRPDGSETNLHPVRDGAVIGCVLLKHRLF